MWKNIRGKGLSYGYRMMNNYEDGFLYFSLTKSTHPFQAFGMAKDLVVSSVQFSFCFEFVPDNFFQNESLKDDFEWDMQEFEAAKSSLIFELVEAEETVASTISNDLVRSLRGLPEDYRKYGLCHHNIVANLVL